MSAPPDTSEQTAPGILFASRTDATMLQQRTSSVTRLSTFLNKATIQNE